jgi:acetyl esterase/lipase
MRERHPPPQRRKTKLGVPGKTTREHDMTISRKWLACAVVVASLNRSSTSMAQCPGFPGCLYQPPQFTFTETDGSVTYTDIAGRARTINILIRQPNLPASPLPVVVWSHGGAEGQTNARAALREWSETTARSGYLTVSIAHTPRGAARRTDLCLALGITDPNDCEGFKYLNWDRPNDIKQVLDDLERRNAQGSLQGRIDLNRIAVGGHSAGSGGILSIAGAVRVFNGTFRSFTDPRPVAFLAFSPQGPTSEGFFDTDFHRQDTSWDPLPRPVLVGTGDGDGGCEPPGNCIPGGESPFGRRAGFNRMPAGGKYLLYIHDADAYHGAFALDGDCVAKGVPAAKCQAFSHWLTSAALAFLDAHVRGVNLAHVWLQNEFIRPASNDTVEWLKK